MGWKTNGARFRQAGLFLLLVLPMPVFAQSCPIQPGGDRVIRNVFGRFDARIAVGPKSFDARILKRESYVIIDGNGKVSSVPLDIDGHDMLVESDRVYAMKYVPESTRFRQNLHFVVSMFDARLEKELWSWSSKGRFPLEVSTYSDTQSFPDDRESFVEKAAKQALIFILSPFDVKYPVRFSRLGKQLRLPTNDYLHANAIIRAPNGNLWISMRYQDAILELDERSDGVVAWIGGKFAPRNDWSIVGDPLEGFSHQHCPQLRGNELHLFDNGNRFDNRTSRAVLYRCDFDRRALTFVKDYPEPNGLHRPTQGSVRVLDGNHILVGWGGLLKKDAVKPQRGVSIFEIDTGREIFGFDLDAGLDSYNANPTVSAHGVINLKQFGICGIIQ